MTLPKQINSGPVEAQLKIVVNERLCLFFLRGLADGYTPEVENFNAYGNDTFVSSFKYAIRTQSPTSSKSGMEMDVTASSTRSENFNFGPKYPAPKFPAILDIWHLKRPLESMIDTKRNGLFYRRASGVEVDIFLSRYVDHEIITCSRFFIKLCCL